MSTPIEHTVSNVQHIELTVDSNEELIIFNNGQGLELIINNNEQHIQK